MVSLIKRKLLGLLGASFLTLTTVSPVMAAPATTPASGNTREAVTSEAIAPLIKEAAAVNGFSERLVLWDVQEGSIQVGITDPTGP